MVGELEVLSDAEHLVHAAADRFVTLASAAVAESSPAIAERGRFTVALAGGSTPEPAYALLAERPRAREIDWPRVEVFWGDERSVPPDHPDSNYRMARRSLLDRVPIPEKNVHRIRGELPPEEAAAAYRLELQNHLGVDGRFDLILLGMGPDGHTASLFPGTGAVQEQEHSVVAVYVEKLDTWRVTLTLPIINAARQVVFLVSGEEKAPALARVHAGDRLTGVHAGEPLPAAMVEPVDGKLSWLVDRDAAAQLPLEF